tara:strand:- start:14 stop:883 length:870 start_codon:yes stop_codon:yes gene_type:complete
MVKIITISILIASYITIAHPLVSVNIMNKTPKQGDAVWVKITTSKKLRSGNISLSKATFKLFKKSNHHYEYLTCIGISRFLKPQKMYLKFSFAFNDGSRYQTQLPIVISAANFTKEHIQLKPKKHKIKQDKPSRRNESRLIGRKFNTITKSKKFTGSFLWPLDGRISSEFGTQRIYNNRPGWSHSGIDIAAVTGTPIKAAQSGTVVLAKTLKVHGNTIMINHGWGILTIYNHLNQLNVNINDVVSKGDIIGTVGSTGIATGPHLHFGISVQSVRINPKDFVNITSKIPI